MLIVNFEQLPRGVLGVVPPENCDLVPRNLGRVDGARNFYHTVEFCVAQLPIGRKGSTSNGQCDSVIQMEK